MNRIKTIFHYIVMQCFLLLTLSPPMGFAYNLPEMGDSSSTSLSPAEEKRLGAEIMLEVRQSPLYNTDPIITDYVQSLGKRLILSSSLNPKDFQFFVINDPRVNAFALPGGYIGINAGLLLVAANESEVASVMAHETAHVTQRHIARMFERSDNLSWTMLALLLGSMILATQNPAMGSSALAGAMAGSVQDMINFTRSNEEEADRVGMDMLAKAAFDPQAMSTFFARMAEANRYNDSFYVPDFLRTHPVNSARVADAASRAQHYPVVKKNDNLSFQLIKHRLQVLFAKPHQDILAYYRAELAKPGFSTQPAWRYGYSLALDKKGQHNEAITQLQNLLKDNRHEKIYYMSLAEIYQAQQQYAAGISLLQGAMQLFPYDEVISVQLTQMLLHSGQYQQAKKVLDKQLRYADEKTPQYYYLLAQTENKLNHPQASHMAHAEYYAMQNDLHSAVRELKRAQQYNKNNAYQQAKISARLKELEAELAFLDL